MHICAPAQIVAIYQVNTSYNYSANNTDTRIISYRRGQQWFDRSIQTNVKPLNISRTLVCNKIVDHSHVVGAPPVGAAPTTSPYLT